MATPLDTTEQKIYYQKPDTIDSPIYDKPNAYDDDDVIPTPHYNAEVAVDDLAVFQTKDGKVKDAHTNSEIPPADIPSESQDSSESSNSGQKITSVLLSHAPSISLQSTVSEDVVYSLSSMSTMSLPEPGSPSTSTNSASSSTSLGAKQMLLDKLRRKTKQDMLVFDIKKQSLLNASEHEIYQAGSTKLAYRKVQPHSYSWGFQNSLFRAPGHNSGYGEPTEKESKVAEARRRAFQKEITVEYGDYHTDEDSIHGPDTLISHDLINKTNSHLLFVYETEFSSYCLRWRRPSILSHDMFCEILLTRKSRGLGSFIGKEDKPEWRAIAAFKSRIMGYLLQVGQLSIDRQALAMVDRPDHMEADLLITCCTLIDLMREVVEKAVGLGNGGIASS
ncbi:hypothetical protein CLU79DRAFT_751873, partial [Phycomyces nitens]